jgi:hypothetical protein
MKFRLKKQFRSCYSSQSTGTPRKTGISFKRFVAVSLDYGSMQKINY